MPKKRTVDADEEALVRSMLGVEAGQTPSSSKPKRKAVAKQGSKGGGNKALNQKLSGRSGIIFRQFDNEEDARRPWRGCPNGNVREGAGGECATYGGRLSASVLNTILIRQGTGLFSRSKPGVLYSSSVRINCAYGGDGGTRKFPGDGGCGDACPTESDLWCNGKAHPTSQMSAVLSYRPGNGYNEVILDPASVEAHLPSSVLAFFIMGGTSKPPPYEHFLEEFHLSASHFPLVRLNLRNREAPFEDVW